MNTAIRPIVWIAVIAASVAVGWYIRESPDPNPASAAPSSPGKFLFLAGGSDPYWDLCVAGAKASAEEMNAELEVRVPTSEGEEGLREQLEWLGTIPGEKYDGIALGPIDPTREATLINAAAEKSPIVTVDSDAPNSRRMFYIGSSNYGAGIMAGQMLKQAVPSGGKVVLLMASEAKTNAVQRRQGLEEELARIEDANPASDDTETTEETSNTNSPEFDIVQVYMDRGDFDVCRDNVREACEQHENLAAIVGTFGYHGPIVLEILDSLSDGRNIQVIAFDEDQRTLDGVAKGTVYATIVQDPFMFGAEAIQMLEKVRRGAYLSLPVGSGAVGVHCKAVTNQNLDEFRSELAKRLETQVTAD